MNKGTRREIVLAVDNERAGKVFSHGEGCPGRGAYPWGPKNKRRAPWGWSREKNF